jgi:two-component system, chemotaxis family, CheB/CheR fusion protein
LKPLWRRLFGNDADADQLRQEIARLQEELESGRGYVRDMLEQHQSGLEELKSAQEELLSSNEEFQSTNEELETAKEELQSANEELTTTNDELRHRNSELRDMAEQLSESRGYADAIVETAREPMIILDSELRIVRVNQSFCRMFKVARDRTESVHLDKLGNGQWNIPALISLLEETLVADLPIEGYDVTHVFPNIGRRTVRLNARRLDWPGHGLILLALEDVTDRLALLDSLRDEARHKNEFLAMLGHELRNPLAAMRNALDLCERTNTPPALKQKAMTMMRRQMEKEIRLVDEMLDLARITHGAITLEKAPIDLRVVVSQAVDEMRHAFDERNQELRVSIPTEIVRVVGDAARLEQAIVNLLSNGAKFTASGGLVHLRLERIGQLVQLTVADNGIGISPDVMPTIFDLFVQGSEGVDYARGGLGLGLTLVRRIVEMHGGSIAAESGGVDQGTTFVVYLPALKEDGEVAVISRPVSNADAAARPCRVLAVDDNSDMADSLAELLRMDGHNVVTANDGTTAIDAARGFMPDVVLLDIGLPGMNGMEVARKLRTLAETRDVLLVAISGYGQTSDRDRALAAGFNHYLVKPADLGRVNGLIYTHQQRRGNGSAID